MTPPQVRVYVPTYRRAHLLPRALRSLQAQTFPHWIAEVRNDAPDDEAPAAIVRQLADSRIGYVHHAQNLGGVRLFNEVFSEQRERFVALLEDDNWWEPAFLERMVAAMEAHPDVTLAWSNQSVWRESPGGEWSNTGKFVGPTRTTPTPVPVSWPHPNQCFGALHANGSMLLRTRPGVSYPTPLIEFGGTEAVRERSFPHPLLYVPEPLAVFSITQTSHRSNQPAAWATIEVLLAATFLKHANVDREYWASLWAGARRASPRMTGILLLACRQDPLLRHHLVYATPGDWWHLAVRGLRRPLVFTQLLRARRRTRELWDFLDHHTAMRAREAGSPAGLPTSPEFLSTG